MDAVDADNISHIHAKLDPIISPIKSGRKGKGVDKHRAKEQGGKMIGGMDLDNPVRDLDMKRWLHETFSRLPLSQKGALIRYQKRWPLLGSIVTVMKKLKISVDGVIEKMKSNFINSHRPFLKINDALADIGFWLDRESVVEVLDKEMLVRRTKTAHLFFTSLDPRKKGSVANFELAALLAVLLHLPWASPWSNSDSTCTPVRATQVNNKQLNGSITLTLTYNPIDRGLFIDCCGRRAAGRNSSSHHRQRAAVHLHILPSGRHDDRAAITSADKDEEWHLRAAQPRPLPKRKSSEGGREIGRS